jgi:hypothetical protein
MKRREIETHSGLFDLMRILAPIVLLYYPGFRGVRAATHYVSLDGGIRGPSQTPQKARRRIPAKYAVS